MIGAQQEFVLESQAARAGRRGPSQSDLVLPRLKISAGKWVSMPALAQASRAYAVHSRVADLRRSGHRIEHRNLWIDGICHSEYRLLP